MSFLVVFFVPLQWLKHQIALGSSPVRPNTHLKRVFLGCDAKSWFTGTTKTLKYPDVNKNAHSDFVSWWQQIRLPPEFFLACVCDFSCQNGTLFQGFLLRKAKLKRWRPLCAATPPRKISKILIWEVFRGFVIFHPAGLWMLTVHIACNSLAKPYHWVISSHTLLKHGFNHCSSWISSSKIPQELRTIQ